MSRLMVFLALVSVAQAGNPFPSEKQTAAEVDQLLSQHYDAEGVTPAPLTRDEDFLRRVSLDLAGRLPPPEQVTLFGLSADPEKRARIINELLDSPDYGKIWASYWKDVIYLRATEARSRLSQGAFQSWMTEQLNANRPWDEITRELLTATGDVRENGSTGLIFAHGGAPEELAAEISRIFMGIRLSCANCHDHPTDSWKREQFHGLAAFLPRIRVRPETADQGRTFIVTSVTDSVRQRALSQNPERVFRLADRNRDGKLAKSEARGPLAQRFDRILSQFDADKDGLLDLEEFQQIRELANQQPGRGSPEYYMPDLQNPASRGTLMQPTFFISTVSGPRLKSGTDDLDRREALAEYITTPDNPWFAKALVNRIWAEMLGEGFYMPVDDMGPQRTATNEDVLQLLADRFVASGYDVKWLFRTIALTQAYQRQLASEESSGSHAAFASASATRLRSDQIYNSITSVLGVPNGIRLQTRGLRLMMAPGMNPQMAGFSALFGFDPSTPQADLLGNVPQALFMMNSPQLDNQISATGGTRLARILQTLPDNEDALQELYFLVLSRSPTADELQINTRYINSVGNRGEAFEDIMWALMNSTEFLSKR